MSYAIQWIRSLIFNASMYVAMLIVGVVYLPWAILSPEGAVAGCHKYCQVVRWLARVLVGLDSEIRGEVPTGEAMVAAKHQSFMDVILIYGALPRGKFIMKNILKYAPILGWFGLRVGCVPVERGKRGAAIKKMLNDVRAGKAAAGQLIIYPQGTRIAPGVVAPYKVGTAALYQELQQPCVPVACNVGVFWPKRGVYRKPGLAVVEFLPPIEPGLTNVEFMAVMSKAVEENSNRLAAEAGFQVNDAA